MLPPCSRLRIAFFTASRRAEAAATLRARMSRLLDALRGLAVVVFAFRPALRAARLARSDALRSLASASAVAFSVLTVTDGTRRGAADAAGVRTHTPTDATM